jgi:hypothetical protein
MTLTKAQADLEEIIPMLTDEQCEILYKIANGHVMGDKRKMLLIAGYTDERQRKIDTAIPQTYADKVRDLVPTWNGMYHVYDYAPPYTFGMFKNVAEEFVTKLTSVFK